MKIAVIGGTGMIGNHTVRQAIKKNHEVTVFHRQSSSLKYLAGLPIKFKQVELSDLDQLSASLNDVDGVIHCAGYYPSLRPDSWQIEVERGLLELKLFFQACKNNQQLKKIIYVGSVVALPFHPQGQPATEDLEFNQSTLKCKIPYLRVKEAMDRFARAKSKQGLPVTICIPGMCLGEFDKAPTTGKIITEVANKKMKAFIAGKRNVIYAGDVGRGIILALEKGRIGERYLLTGTNIEIKDLIQNIARKTKVKPPRLAIPKPLAMGAAVLMEKFTKLFKLSPSLLNTTTVSVSNGQYLNGVKAKKELGFEPEYNIDKTLDHAINWFKENNYI